MIKYCYLWIVCTFILGVCSANEQQKSCRTVFSEMNKKQLTWINQCVKQLGYKTGREKSQKTTCVMVCVLKNLDLIGQDGNIDGNQFNKYLVEQWPEHLHERANLTFHSCLKMGHNANTQDEFCKGYDPFVKCLTRNFAGRYLKPVHQRRRLETAKFWETNTNIY